MFRVPFVATKPFAETGFRFRPETALLRIVLLASLASASASGCSRGAAAVALVPSETDQVSEAPLLLLSEASRAEQYAARFQIRNLSEATMAVVLVDKSCGCERLHLPEEGVGPGQTATVTMLISPPSKAERKAYRATLRLDWAEYTEVMKLRTELEVLSDVVMEPSELAHDFVSDEFCVRQLGFKQRVRTEAKPEPLTPQVEDLPDEVELVTMEHIGTKNVVEGEGRKSRHESRRRQDQSGEAEDESPETFRAPIWEIEWRATLRLTPTERIREGFTGQCTLVARGPDAPTLQIPIRLRRVDSIQLAPPYLYFGRVKPDEERNRTLLVRGLDDQGFELTDVSSDSPAFVGRIANSGPKKLHTLQVAFRSFESGQYTGTIRVATTHPQCPAVSFGVEGTVEGQPSDGALVANSDPGQ